MRDYTEVFSNEIAGKMGGYVTGVSLTPEIVCRGLSAGPTARAGVPLLMHQAQIIPSEGCER
jgi:hypothetical protein